MQHSSPNIYCISYSPSTSFCVSLSSTLHPTYSTPSFCLLLSSTLHSPYLPVHLSAYCYPALFILPIFQSIFLLTANQQSSFYLSSSPSFCLLLYSTLHPTNLPVHLPVYRYLHSTYSISSSPSFVYRYLALFILLIFQSIFYRNRKHSSSYLSSSPSFFFTLFSTLHLTNLPVLLLFTAIQHSSSY